MALASCRVTAAKAKAKAKAAEATATVDDSVDPGRRLHCDHERPSGAQPGAPHPAKLEIFRGHSFSRCYAALALGAAIACRFSCRNTPTQHLLVCHGLPGLIALGGRAQKIVGALYRLRNELSYTDGRSAAWPTPTVAVTTRPAAGIRASVHRSPGDCL